MNTIMTVIPRISSLVLIEQKISEMNPADLTAMSVEVVTFLLKKSVIAGFTDSLTVDDLVTDIATIFH